MQIGDLQGYIGQPPFTSDRIYDTTPAGAGPPPPPLLPHPPITTSLPNFPCSPMTDSMPATISEPFLRVCLHA